MKANAQITHLQFPQAYALTKNCKRVIFSNARNDKKMRMK